MARDATARLYDVDADVVVLDKKAGTITFKAKPGRLIDLGKLHESVWASRLGTNTGMELKRLDVIAEGEVVLDENKEVRLKVPGTNDYFLLGDNSTARPREGEKTSMQRLREAVRRGEVKTVRVTGRLDGWTGNFTKFLQKLPPKPYWIIVNEFEVVKR